MSESPNAAEPQQPPRRRWRPEVLGLAAAVIIIVLVVFQAARTPHATNALELRGGLTIEVEPHVEIYLGHTYLGAGPLDLSWDQLLGAAEQQPLAMPLNRDTPSPSFDQMGGVTAEALAGEGAQIVWSASGMAGSVQNIEPFAYAWKRVILERPDGQLDFINVLDAEFAEHDGAWRRFLVPIRLRSADDSVVYFSDTPGGAVSSRRGGILPAMTSSLQVGLRSRSGTPPEEFADRIEQHGFWKPARQTHATEPTP